MAEVLKEIFSKSFPGFTIIGKTSEDKMKLFIDVNATDRNLISRTILNKAIIECAPGVIFNQGVVDDIADRLKIGEQVLERRIAKGVLPKPGTDGKILLLVKQFSAQASITSNDSGQVDFTKLNLFDNVISGQSVARLYRPKPGVSGKNVLGEDIPFPPGNPAKVEIDNTVSIKNEPETEPFDLLIAEKDGCVLFSGQKLSIMEELVINGDLDYRFGSIDFVGKVRVKGDVMPGFSIRAKRGIEIEKNVRGGSLVSSEGAIIVKEFVYGGDDGGKIISGESFKAKIVQQINAEIKGDIIIEKESNESQLRCGGNLLMTNGHCYGGECFPVGGAEFKILGSEGGKKTIVNLCSDVESSLEYQELFVSIANHEKVASLLRVHLGPLAENPTRLQLLNPAHRSKMQGMLTKLGQVEQSKLKLIENQQQLLLNAKVNTTHRINFIKEAHEGVIFKTRETDLVLSERVAGPKTVTYLSDTGELSIGVRQDLESKFEVISNINLTAKQDKKEDTHGK